MSNNMAAVTKRLCEAFNVKSSMDLAHRLHVSAVSPSTIREQGVPSRWLVLAARRGFHPDWIENGTPPKYLIPSNYPSFGYTSSTGQSIVDM